MTPPVRIRSLIHAYDREPVLRLDELDLPPGRWHLAGPNGAGKTTLLRILATLTRPTRGRVEVAGHRLPDEAASVRRHAAFAGHEPSLHASLPARRALAMHARLHGVGLPRVDEALEAWGLAGVRDEPVAALSHGQRRRLDLARCLLHSPDVVLLDEPSSGLDETARAVLAERLAEEEPELMLVAAPHEPALETGPRLTLDAGRLREVTP